MLRKYDNNFKSMIVNLIVNEKHSTIKTAEQFDIDKITETCKWPLEKGKYILLIT